MGSDRDGSKAGGVGQRQPLGPSGGGLTSSSKILAKSALVLGPIASGVGRESTNGASEDFDERARAGGSAGTGCEWAGRGSAGVLVQHWLYACCLARRDCPGQSFLHRPAGQRTDHLAGVVVKRAAARAFHHPPSKARLAFRIGPCDLSPHHHSSHQAM